MTLEIITSEALSPLRHGFFTRRGGASSGIFQGLNCGPGSSDQAEIVAINRARVAQAMDLAPDHLVTVHQVHSADVVHVTGPLSDKPRADGIVTATPGVALAILTADCQPVLFADTHAGVIGADRAHIHAVIGPSISQSAYEVGPEFFDDFMAEDSDNARFFAQGAGDRMMFALPAYGLHRLRGAGVGHAEWTRHCTYSEPERFFAYRRTTHAGEADYGRLISAIRL